MSTIPKYSDEGVKIALIINVTTDRKGSKKDTKRLQKHLGYCGFEVTEVKNLTKEGIINELAKWKRKYEFKLVSLSLVAVMSRGTHGDMFYDADREKVDYDACILQPFSDSEFENMKEKPKIFLANFCRGEDGLEPDGDVMDYRKPYKTVYPTPTKNVTDSVQESPAADSSRVFSGVHMIYATVKDRPAWREAGGGAYLIKGFCKALEAHANGHSTFEQLMKSVDGYFRNQLDGIQSLVAEYIGVNQDLYLLHRNAQNTDIGKQNRIKVIELAAILAKDEVIITKVETFHTHFPCVRLSDIVTTLRSYRNATATLDDLISVTLTKWVSANGSEANASLLVDILTRAGFQGASEAVCEAVTVEGEIGQNSAW